MQPKVGTYSKESLRKIFEKIDWSTKGKVTQIVGNMIEAEIPNIKIGTTAHIEIHGSEKRVIAEVVGFKGKTALLLPYNNLDGVSAGCLVSPMRSSGKIKVGDHLLGKVIDAHMVEMGCEGKLPFSDGSDSPLEAPPIDPMKRKRIEEPMILGIRAIDGLMTFGAGQRIGLMAAAGVGKSVLMGMIARNSEADINVIGLIGERGREVREFVERDLQKAGLQKSIVVAVTGDNSPLLRVRGAKIATTIAEHFSRQGKNVMLMIDSLTRVAMAQREIGNTVGELPTAKGYTPSVFSLLPKLLERAGPQPNGYGNISAIYTILVEGNDFDEPISDACKSILDGHIALSPELASRGHFPAIDIPSSISRVMTDILPKEQIKFVNFLKGLIAEYQQQSFYVQAGIYKPGSNPRLDQAINLMPEIENFLRQDWDENADYNETIQSLINLFHQAHSPSQQESQT